VTLAFGESILCELSALGGDRCNLPSLNRQRQVTA
jgi:hypothetical protein